MHFKFIAIAGLFFVVGTGCNNATRRTDIMQACVGSKLKDVVGSQKIEPCCKELTEYVLSKNVGEQSFATFDSLLKDTMLAKIVDKYGK